MSVRWMLLAVPAAMVGLGVYQIYQVYHEGSLRKTRMAWAVSAESGERFASCAYVPVEGTEDEPTSRRLICE